MRSKSSAETESFPTGGVKTLTDDVDEVCEHELRQTLLFDRDI